ncbi:MAG: cupin domain-containing protein [Candidatus Saccharibacteria bacterium]|nr:cupin domain-containing protein [Pseudorhodobacter sp.]
MRVDPALVQILEDGVVTRLWSQAGGLTQFGAHIQTLPPGAQSSERHWHSVEDEFLLVLAGQATVVDDAGPRVLGPGDAVGWRFGEANGHHVLNHGAGPVSFVIVGSRVAGDICTYPDSGTRQIHGPTDWQVMNAAGQVLRGGALPPELLGLPENWGVLAEAGSQRYLPEATRVWTDEPDVAHPVLGQSLGQWRHGVLGDAAGLSQFGAYLDELPPGSQSSLRHWHETEDEMVLVLKGEVVLVEDSETVLHSGDVACWPAGLAVGHCLCNRSAAPVQYLVIGTRHARDRVHYPDHDAILEKVGTTRLWYHADGRDRSV